MPETAPVTTRRSILRGTLGGLAALTTASSCASGGRAPAPAASSDFYGPDGAFDAATAKAAYFALMERFGYPIPQILHTETFWVCDFLQGDFARLGMGGIFWTNAAGRYGRSGAGQYHGSYQDASFGYLGHEIFLLPGQMLPEHRHLGGPEGYPPKMEAWQVRYGSVEFFGEYAGEGSESPLADLPAAERPWGYGAPWFKSRYVARRTALSGEVYSLLDPESWHSQRAGAEGAIVTEYATHHNHVTFSKPGMGFASTPARS